MCRIQPEESIYAQTLQHMSDDGTVVVELKDGRRVWGCPRKGPASKDDGINELYLVYPQAEHEGGEWRTAGAAAIVPLSEVSQVVLSEEPTNVDQPTNPQAASAEASLVPPERLTD